MCSVLFSILDLRAEAAIAKSAAAHGGAADIEEEHQKHPGEEGVTPGEEADDGDVSKYVTLTKESDEEAAAPEEGGGQGKEPSLSVLQLVLGEVSAVKHFSKMFWLVAVCAVLNYAIVMPWNNTAQAELLERDLFRPARDITECCCWSGHKADCFAQWPDDDGNIHIPSADEAARCRNGYVEGVNGC